MNVQPFIPALSKRPFHVEVNGGNASIVADDNQIRLDLNELESVQLLELKNLAHNQYVRAMLFDDGEVNVHRATLNLICRLLERKGNPVSLAKSDRVRKRGARTTLAHRSAEAA